MTELRDAAQRVSVQHFQIVLLSARNCSTSRSQLLFVVSDVACDASVSAESANAKYSSSMSSQLVHLAEQKIKSLAAAMNRFCSRLLICKLRWKSVRIDYVATMALLTAKIHESFAESLHWHQRATSGGFRGEGGRAGSRPLFGRQTDAVTHGTPHM